MTSWLITKLRIRIKGTSFSIKIETNLLKLSIVLRIGLLYLYQMIGDSVFSKQKGINYTTVFSLNMLGKSMNLISLLMNGNFTKYLMVNLRINVRTNYYESGMDPK